MTPPIYPWFLFTIQGIVLLVILGLRFSVVSLRRCLESHTPNSGGRRVMPRWDKVKIFDGTSSTSTRYVSTLSEFSTTTGTQNEAPVLVHWCRFKVPPLPKWPMPSKRLCTLIFKACCCRVMISIQGFELASFSKLFTLFPRHSYLLTTTSGRVGKQICCLWDCCWCVLDGILFSSHPDKHPECPVWAGPGSLIWWTVT